MSRVVMLGAETGHIHAEALTVTGTAATYDTGTVRSGARSYKFDASAQATLFYNFTGAVSRRMWATCWFLLPAATGLPGTASRIIQWQTGAGTGLCSATLRADGKIRLVNQANVQIGSDSSATVTTDTWYRLDLGVEIETGSTDFAECRLDGTTVATSAVQAFSDTAPGRIHFGWFDDPGTSEVIFMDDIVINDEQGSVNNTWPGANEKVVLLLPTADSARDTGWVAGSAGTTNLYDAVDNRPPVGVANASGTITSQIRNAVTTTTEAYSATMQTYAAAGVTSGDTVTAVQAVIEAGSTTTTAHTIGVQVTSNPTIAEATPTSNTITGTYPSNWSRGTTAIEENPTVTVGTAPVMRVRKNFAATNATIVCLMGMTVSYTVGTATTTTTPAPGGGTRLRFILSMLIAWLRQLRRRLWLGSNQMSSWA